MLRAGSESGGGVWGHDARTQIREGKGGWKDKDAKRMKMREMREREADVGRGEKRGKETRAEWKEKQGKGIASWDGRIGGDTVNRH